MPFTVEYRITLQLALSLLENVEISDDDLNEDIGIGPVHNFEEVLTALKFVIEENLEGKNIFMKICGGEMWFCVGPITFDITLGCSTFE